MAVTVNTVSGGHSLGHLVHGPLQNCTFRWSKGNPTRFNVPFKVAPERHSLPRIGLVLHALGRHILPQFVLSAPERHSLPRIGLVPHSPPTRPGTT